MAFFVLFRWLYRHALGDRLGVRRWWSALQASAGVLCELSSLLFGGGFRSGEVRDCLCLRVVRVVLFFPYCRHPGALARSAGTGVGHEELALEPSSHSM